MRWSVARFCGKLYVRIFSARSPEPIWLLRASRALGVLALLLRLEQAGAQDPQRLCPVLVLALLVLAVDDDAGREVRDAHRGVRRVDALAARDHRRASRRCGARSG